MRTCPTRLLVLFLLHAIAQMARSQPVIQFSVSSYTVAESAGSVA
jgi:hypothetical protein